MAFRMSPSGRPRPAARAVERLGRTRPSRREQRRVRDDRARLSFCRLPSFCTVGARLYRIPDPVLKPCCIGDGRAWQASLQILLPSPRGPGRRRVLILVVCSIFQTNGILGIAGIRRSRHSMPTGPVKGTERPPRRKLQLLKIWRKLAERQGFEPWEGLHPQRFSRPPRSTAPASLRGRNPI